MLIEDLKMCESLRRIVNGFTADPTLQQDMFQECLVCLWKIEAEKPGRTRSWYLQNCRFHVQHWLAAGRSLDSHKRAHGGNRIALHDTDDEATLDDYHTDGELFDTVSVRDLVSTLTPLLHPPERVVLRGLAEGLALREIMSKSGISYPTALKYRRRIAALASRLGICLPVSQCQQKAGAVPNEHRPKAQPVLPKATTEKKLLRRLGSVRTSGSRTAQKKQELTQLAQAKVPIKARSVRRQTLANQSRLLHLAEGTSRRLAA
jgi:hypothetical protein